MKIGLIADIHADLESLYKALKVLRGRGGEQVLCAGDLAEKGPDINAVVTVIRKLDIPCVRGNHDQAAIGNYQWWLENGSRSNPVWQSYYALSDQVITFLGELPLTRRFELSGRSLLLAHGTPWSEHVYLYHNNPPLVYERIWQETQADLVVVGHTHIPMRVRYKNMWVVNPGSVAGKLTEGSHTCGLLTLPEGKFQVLDIYTGDEIDVPETLMPS